MAAAQGPRALSQNGYGHVRHAPDARHEPMEPKGRPKGHQGGPREPDGDPMGPLGSPGSLGSHRPFGFLFYFIVFQLISFYFMLFEFNSF